MLHYKLFQDNRKTSLYPGKWYARAVNVETKDIEALAEHMSLHNTPFSKGVITGILTDMVACIHELTLSGVAVKLADLAIFSLGIKTSPAKTAADFTPQQNIKSYHLRARATGKFSPTELKSVANITEQDNYKVDKGKKTTEKTQPTQPTPKS